MGLAMPRMLRSRMNDGSSLENRPGLSDAGGCARYGRNPASGKEPLQPTTIERRLRLEKTTNQ